MTLTVITPSLGVRIWPEADGRVRIGFATEGGRGVPRAALALPVQRDGDAWRCPPGLLDALRREGPAFWHGARSGWRYALDPQRGPSNAVVDSHALVAVDPSLPRCERFGPFAWSDWDGAHVMLLLVYPQLPSVGGDAPTRSGAGDDEAAALASFFHAAARERRLARRGLVRLPAVDASTEVTIALSSCQYPADLLDGSPRRLLSPPGPADASLLRLHSRLQGDSAPSLLVLTGDQVYVDATAGLFDTRRADDRYRVPYQNLLGSAGAQAVFGLVPTAMVLDDHEIDNNWEPAPGAPRPDPAAIDAYWRFQRLAGPPRRGDGLWCELVHRGVPLFLADTRTERSPRDALRVDVARMMSDAQSDALFAFLRRCRGR
ncbi:MAG TPA: alkaline phosphatase D family protein, partial [Albitalea sp.]